MKFFAWFVMILALVSSAVALKDEICGLPHSADGKPNGRHCKALFFMWSYDQSTNDCVEFRYGGCGGNANRFDAKEECEEKCKE